MAVNHFHQAAINFVLALERFAEDMYCAADQLPPDHFRLLHDQATTLLFRGLDHNQDKAERRAGTRAPGRRGTEKDRADV